MAQTPSPSNPAAELIAQLRNARTPLARARVVVGAWRTVRSLSPRDRSNLVTQLGLEGADDLVETIAAHQGTKAPVELIQAVNQMQKLDPEELRSAALRMRDPRQRGAVIQEGLKALETKLAGPPPGPPAGFTAARPAPPATPPPAPPPRAAPAAAAASAPVTVMPATSWPLRASTPPAAPVAQPAPAAPEPAPAVKAEPAPSPVVLTPVPIPSPPPAPEPARPVPAASAVPATVANPPAAAVRGSLAEELAAVTVLTARFRLLRRRLAAARQLSPGELRGVVEVFEDGWARRRALSEILRAGIPARTADALALMETLGSPADRAWCLGTLADSRTLSSEERATIIQAAPTPAGRRRLELRLHEA